MTLDRWPLNTISIMFQGETPDDDVRQNVCVTCVRRSHTLEHVLCAGKMYFWEERKIKNSYSMQIRIER